jgi:hypothetical protein
MRYRGFYSCGEKGMFAEFGDNWRAILRICPATWLGERKSCRCEFGGRPAREARAISCRRDKGAFLPAQVCHSAGRAFGTREITSQPHNEASAAAKPKLS